MHSVKKTCNQLKSKNNIYIELNLFDKLVDRKVGTIQPIHILYCYLFVLYFFFSILLSLVLHEDHVHIVFTQILLTRLSGRPKGVTALREFSAPHQG